MDSDEPDPLAVICRDHFEEAMKFAGRSVSDSDISKDEMLDQTSEQTSFGYGQLFKPSVTFILADSFYKFSSSKYRRDG